MRGVMPSVSAANPQEQSVSPLYELGRQLRAARYEFTTVTPATHQMQNARPGNELARSLRDVFGWSRPFSPELLPSAFFEALLAAEACEKIPGTAHYRPLVRFSSLGGSLFAHSAFPTRESDAVFFGPDSYRFARVIQQCAPKAERVVDIGAGSGVGGIVLAKAGLAAKVVLADINLGALRIAEVNARLADVSAEVVQSNVLQEVTGTFDLVISNPPYLRDESQRLYRDGGGSYGEQLAVRIVRESVSRLRAMPRGGRILLYTGAAIVSGRDTFFDAVSPELADPDLHSSYEELDPDVFSDELERPAYAEVERIAAVFLSVRVGPVG